MASTNLNTRLFIEGREVDLSDDIDLALTYTLDNVQDISKINSNFSKTIVVPGSHNNNILFNYIFDIKSVGGAQQGAIGFYHPSGVTIDGVYTPPPNIDYNYNPLMKARAYIMQGSSVCMSGYARLISATSLNGDISYEIQINSDLGAFISTLGQYRLEDLALPSATTYDQTLSFTTKLDAGTIVNSWDFSTCNPESNVPFWPLIDYGDFDTINATNFYVQNFRPCLFAKHYWDMIFQFAGYRYSSDFIDSRFFRRLIIPYKDGALLPKAGSASATNITSEITQILSTNTVPGGDGVYPFPNSVGTSTVYAFGVFTSPLSNTYQLNVNFQSTLRMQPTDSVSACLNNDYYVYVIYDRYQSDGTTIISQEYDVIKFNRGTYTVNGSGTITESPGPTAALTKSTFLNAGEKLKVRVMGKMDNTYPFVLVGWPGVIPINGNAWLIVNEHPSLTISYGTVSDQSTVDFGQFVPKDVKMVDYINSIIKLFNLYPVIDMDDPFLFHIYTREEFYDGLVDHDWTAKVDNSQAIKTVPIPSLDSKNLKFTYKEDKDWWNKNYTQQYGGIYGQLLVNTGYEFSNETKEVLDKLVFSPTVPVQYANNPFPCETTIEVLNSDKSTLQVSGYHTLAGGTLPSGNSLSKARVGNKIIYFGQEYTITWTSAYNPYRFSVDRDVVRSGGAIDGTYYAKTDTFQYVTNNDKAIPCIYDSTDNNVTRKFIKTNLKILCWAEGDQTSILHPDLVPCNSYSIQPTPIISGTSYVYIDVDGGIKPDIFFQFVPNTYPALTHLNGYKNSGNAVNGTAPTQDILFSEPIATFFDSTGFNYPSFNLYTGYWMNNVNELIDPEAKLVNINMDIDPVDINQLDLRDYIYIDGTRYRINKITDYRPDRALTTNVELVRLPYRQYQDNPVLSYPIEIILRDQASTGTVGNIKVEGIDVEPARYYYLDTIGPGQESIFTTRFRGTGTLTVDADADTRYVSVQYGTTSHTQLVTGGTLTYTFTGTTFAYQGPIVVTLSDTGTPDGPPPAPEYAYFSVYGNPNTNSTINDVLVYNDPSQLHPVEYVSGSTLPGIDQGRIGLFRTSITSNSVPANVRIQVAQVDGDFLTLQGPPSTNIQQDFTYWGGGIYDFNNILLLPNQTYNAWIDGPNPGTIIINNGHGFTSITQVTNVARFSLSSPVPGYNYTSGTHAGFAAVIGFSITTSSNPAYKQGHAIIYKNGAVVDHINYYGSGTYGFNQIISYKASDFIYISFEAGEFSGVGSIDVNWNYDGPQASQGHLDLYVNGLQVLSKTTGNGGSIGGTWSVNPGDTVQGNVIGNTGRIKDMSVYDGGTLLYFDSSNQNKSFAFTAQAGHGYTILGSLY